MRWLVPIALLLASCSAADVTDDAAPCPSPDALVDADEQEASPDAAPALPITALRILVTGTSICDGSSFPGGPRVALWSRAVAEVPVVEMLGRRETGPTNLGDRHHECWPARTLVDLRLGGGSPGQAVPDGGVPAWLKAQPSQPTVIVVEGGINDLAAGESPFVTCDRMGFLLDDLHESAPDARLFVVPDPVAGGTWAQLEPKRLLYLGCLPGIAASHNATMVAQRLTRDDMHDGLHPGPQGYAKLGSDIWEAVR